MKIIKTPWKEEFISLVESSEQSIKICSPFVKFKVVEELYKHKNENTQFSLVTNFNLENFHKNVSDLGAMRYILDKNGEIKNYQRLHAKFYIFDNKSIIITSANLTEGGLTKNFEYGIFSDEKDIVNKVCEDFKYVCSSDLSGKINIMAVNKIKDILDTIPKEKKIKFPEITGILAEETEPDELYDGGLESIEKNLSGWKLAVFNQLNKIDDFIFSLDDIYRYKPHLEKLYPDNKNIEDKIRQQLQFLRDLGLVKFLGKGRYKKLWIR